MRRSLTVSTHPRPRGMVSASRLRGARIPQVLVIALAAATAITIAGVARATPSTTYWAPSTTYVQPFGVPHLTYDSYFRKNASYPLITGVTIGVLPFDKLQLEVGYDLLLPSHDPVLFLLNAKLGMPEDVFFKGSPSLAVGVFGAGIKGKSGSDNGTSWDVLYGQIQKNLPWGGYLSVGGYYGAGTKELWLGNDGNPHRAGFIGAATSPDINVNLPGLKKLIVVADAQTGNNFYGAAGGGVYFYFNDFIDILTGPVYFFDHAAQPGEDKWMWTVQLDVDIPFKAAPPTPAAAPPPEPPAPPAASIPPASPAPPAAATSAPAPPP